ncbi:MAG TPA: hypothetical protein VN843_14280 [Anaerolineales bacterium]|nr:hypothetical protein [Anaerolineales bacterium]
MLIRDLFSVQKYVEGGIEQGESEVKRNDLREELKTSLHSMLKPLKVDNGPVLVTTGVFGKG